MLELYNFVSHITHKYTNETDIRNELQKYLQENDESVELLDTYMNQFIFIHSAEEFISAVKEYDLAPFKNMIFYLKEILNDIATKDTELPNDEILFKQILPLVQNKQQVLINAFKPGAFFYDIKHAYFILLQLSNTDWNKINEVCIQHCIDYIKKQYIKINNTIKATNIDDLGLEVGESIEIDHIKFHQWTHTDKYIPIIYVNGNVISGEKISSEFGRQHHDELFFAYCRDWNLHKNDIHKKSQEYWRKLQPSAENMFAWAVARAVKSDVDIVVMSFYNSRVKRAFEKEYHCKIYAIDDSGRKLTRFAKNKLIKQCKRLMTKK